MDKATLQLLGSLGIDKAKGELIDETLVRSLIPERKRATNKGSYGRALIVAGSRNMPGAAVMATGSCIRAGAGLTRAFVPAEIFPQFSRLPEAMLCPDSESIFDQLVWADAVGIGCGMGGDERRRDKLESVLKSGKRAVIDADALNTLDESLIGLLNENHVLTPHPGEMSRLIKRPVGEILTDPVKTASEFSKAHGCVLLLKNAASVIARPDGKVRINTSGNTGLAKGGSGDVLTGMITALIAQGLEPFDAATAGSYLLGASAEKAFDLLKERMITASDVTEALKMLIGDRSEDEICLF